MKYSEQIKSPKWQKKRLEVLNLRGFKCELCGCEEKQLHVHHHFYINGRLIHEYDNDVLQVLCEDCHKKEHAKKDYSKYDELISIIENHDDGYDTDILQDLELIVGTVYDKGESDFISNLAESFEDNFHVKILFDLSTNARLNMVQRELHILKLNHGK